MQAEKEATEENSRMCDGLVLNWLVLPKPKFLRNKQVNNV